MPQYWAACYTHPQSETIVRRGVEDIGVGAFLPSYSEYSKKRERVSWRSKALLPGYVLIAIDGTVPWGEVARVKGVSRVLTNAGVVSRVTDAEMAELVMAHASGAYNAVESHLTTKRGKRKRRRRPRHGRKVSTYECA